MLTIFVALLVFGWWRRRRQMRGVREGRSPVVTDEVLREILGRGSIEGSESPLDEEEIRAAEDRFWEEAEWDEPEERGV